MTSCMHEYYSLKLYGNGIISEKPNLKLYNRANATVDDCSIFKALHMQ